VVRKRQRRRLLLSEKWAKAFEEGRKEGRRVKGEAGLKKKKSGRGGKALTRNGKEHRCCRDTE